MRLEKTADIIKLAMALSADADGLTIDEIQAKFGVSRRTAERMRDAVEMAFGPLDPTEDGRKIRFRLTTRGLKEFFTAPTVEELTELDDAARALESAQAPERAAHLRSLRDKISVSLRDSDRRRLHMNVEDQLRAETFARQVGPRPMADASVLADLREALLRGKIVRFDYGGTEKEPPKWRKVVPYGLLFGPRYYLVAGIRNRRGVFLYRLDSIHNLAITDESAAPPPDFDLKAYAERSFGVYQEEPQDIVISFAPSAARDGRAYLFHPTQTMTDELDGSLTVRFHAGALLQIAHHLMTWGDAATIVAPKALQDVMREQVAALYRHYVEPQASAGSKRRPSTRNSNKSSS